MYEHNIADKLTTFVNEVYNSIANQASDRVLFVKTNMETKIKIRGDGKYLGLLLCQAW